MSMSMSMLVLVSMSIRAAMSMLMRAAMPSRRTRTRSQAAQTVEVMLFPCSAGARSGPVVLVDVEGLPSWLQRNE